MAVYLDIYIGDIDAHEREQAAYEATLAVLTKNASIYGLPDNPVELSEEEQSILQQIDNSLEMRFVPPPPLNVGRMIFDLDTDHGLFKTVNNFVNLCSGAKGMSKNAPAKRLHYLDSPIHRIESGFIAQGGDITRGDGSGGESIYGKNFNDDKAGLKVKATKGCLAMANSGKNSNSSQFFVVLTDEGSQLAKLHGRYVVFGQLRKECWPVLDRLNAAGSSSGVPISKVWVGQVGEC